MKKFIIITLANLFIVFIMIWLFFFNGRLIIKISPTPATILLDGKEYKNINNLDVKLRAKKYNIKIKKEFYKEFSKDVELSLWQTKNLDIKLELTESAKELKKITESVSEIWINFSTNKKSVEFLNQIKPYLATNVYESLELNVSLSAKPTSSGVKTLLPNISGPINAVDIVSLNKDLAKIKVVTTPLKNIENSVSSLIFDFKKIDNEWVVVNITYKYQ